MRKFVYHQSVIYECEVVRVFPTPTECKGNEGLYIVESPEQFKGEKWYSHFFQDTSNEAYEYAEKIIVANIENSFRKKRESFTDWQLEEKLKTEIDKIIVVML